jgi:hypothetical protein
LEVDKVVKVKRLLGADLGVVVCEDKLYVVGGRDAEGTDLDSVEVYDFATGASSLPPCRKHEHTSTINAVVQHNAE